MSLVMTEEEKERYWSKVDKQDINSCWIYQSADHNQYGHRRIWLQGQYYSVHRIAFYLFTGFHPGENIEVCHSCDIPACVNPFHLFLGSKRDNQLDKVAKGRHTYGSKNGAAKLSEEEVVAIRLLYATGDYSMRQLSEALNLSKSTIHNVVSKKSQYWRNI